MKEKKQIGIIGLGKMGGNLAQQFLEKGWEVVGYNRSKEKTDELAKDGLIPAYSLKEVAEKLSGPRIVWLMLPAGDVVDETINGANGIAQHLGKDDIIIDAGNGFYKDAARRSAELQKLHIRFMDVGVSGGPDGARHGACMMAGGDSKLYEELRHLFDDVNVPGGHAHFPGVGAGHFVKMVHNGIEYGMMQAIAEGFAVMGTCDKTMNECTYNLDLKEVARVYNHGSVIESRLIGWLHTAFEDWGTDLDEVRGKANQLGEGKWTAEVAERMGVPHNLISESIEAREYSQKVPSYQGKVIQALRGQFGRHPVLKSQEPTKQPDHTSATKKEHGIKAESKSEPKKKQETVNKDEEKVMNRLTELI